MADEYGVAVVLTNQFLSRFDGTTFFKPDPTSPVAGNIILPGPITTRLQLRRGTGDTRHVNTFQSPLVPDRDATFVICHNGIGNALK